MFGPVGWVHPSAKVADPRFGVAEGSPVKRCAAQTLVFGDAAFSAKIRPYRRREYRTAKLYYLEPTPCIMTI